MSNTNTVCRNILDAQSVVKERVTELLVEKLVPLGVTTKDCQNLSLHISKCVDTQTDALIDRITDELRK